MQSAPVQAIDPKPQPGLIKTIGVLNILVGGLLLLCGVGCLSLTAPVVSGRVPLRLEPATTQAFADEIRSRRVEELNARAQDATPEERATIEEKTKALRTNHPRVEDEIDFPRVNAELVWPARYLKLELLTGPLLNALLVVSGFGLLLRQDWARRLGMATAALKIVRLVALAVLSIGFVLPHAGAALDALLKTDTGRQIITQAIERQQPSGVAPAAPPPRTEEVVASFRGFAIICSVGIVCVGSIYPAIVLILLGHGGARAALSRNPPAEESPVVDG
jgi:hypothetical protein